jgi:nitrate reductase gamma subunit
MSLLEFARGPGMHVALAVFVAGCLWRLVGVLLLRGNRDLSEPRTRATWTGLRLIALRSWPRREFLEGTAFGEIMGYTFHIGFLLVLFFYVPHILFFADLLQALVVEPLRLSVNVPWPSLPTSIVSLLAVVSVVALLATLIHRLVHPVKRLISNFDDYCSWILTVAPLATGLLAYGHVGGMRYETLLAAHLLAAEALLIWFPFGKLMHAFTIFAARGATGMLFERKGAAL